MPSLRQTINTLRSIAITFLFTFSCSQWNHQSLAWTGKDKKHDALENHFKRKFTRYEYRLTSLNLPQNDYGHDDGFDKLGDDKERLLGSTYRHRHGHRHHYPSPSSKSSKKSKKSKSSKSSSHSHSSSSHSHSSSSYTHSHTHSHSHSHDMPNVSPSEPRLPSSKPSSRPSSRPSKKPSSNPSSLPSKNPIPTNPPTVCVGPECPRTPRPLRRRK